MPLPLPLMLGVNETSKKQCTPSKASTLTLTLRLGLNGSLSITLSCQLNVLFSYSRVCSFCWKFHVFSVYENKLPKWKRVHVNVESMKISTKRAHPGQIKWFSYKIMTQNLQILSYFDNNNSNVVVKPVTFVSDKVNMMLPFCSMTDSAQSSVLAL